MKKLLMVTGMFAVFFVFGCAKYDPQNVAKDHVEKQFKSGLPIKADTSGLKYDIVEKTDTHATVAVSGTVGFEGKIFLVKQGKNWKIAEKESVKAEPGVVH